jgi:flagellar M-ring protein FliF
MAFLNQAIGQVRELFLSMTPAARVTALLLLGVIGISLAFLFQQHGARPDDYLFGGEYLPAREADLAYAAIAQAGLNNAERVGNRIRVPQGKKSVYLAAVAKAGALPTNYDTLMEKALDPGPFVDSETRRQRIKTAKEQQIALILRDWDGIADAKVIYDITPPTGLSRRQQATATVSVRPAPGEPLDPRQIKMIQKTVAGAVAGLSPENVHIANQVDGSFYGSGSNITAETFNDPYFQNRINFEHLMEDKIKNLLHSIPGVQVTITAELDDTVTRTTESVKPDGEGIAIRDIGSEDETTNTKSEEGGRPGLVAQGPLRTGEQSALEKSVNKTVNTSHQTDSFVGTTREIIQQTGFVPQQVQAAIAIPSNYLFRVWHERNQDAAEDAQPDREMLGLIETNLRDQIKNLVTPLLPRQPEKNPYPSVEIIVFDSLTPDPVESPSVTSQSMTWASQNIGNLMMGGVTLICLVMLRSMVKSIPPEDPVPDLGTSTLPYRQETDHASRSSDDQSAADSSHRPRLRLNKGPTLKDDLTDIVREDPEAAATILRTWIGNAS